MAPLEEYFSDLHSYLGRCEKRANNILDGKEPLVSSEKKENDKPIMIHRGVWSTETEARKYSDDAQGIGFKKLTEDLRVLNRVFEE
jgi:hypothetical protein